jgi:SAM-dependent methyltransferase
VHWCKAQGLPRGAALDVGCAVGRTSFDLSPHFDRVVGLDFSHAFIAAAQAIQTKGSASYECTVEGERTAVHTALLPHHAVASRITFLQGDACALPPVSTLGGPFTVIHAANLLCRLPDPMCVRAGLERASAPSLTRRASHPFQAFSRPPPLVACPRWPCRSRVTLLLAHAVHAPRKVARSEEGRRVAGRARRGHDAPWLHAFAHGKLSLPHPGAH